MDAGLAIPVPTWMTDIEAGGPFPKPLLQPIRHSFNLRVSRRRQGALEPILGDGRRDRKTCPAARINALVRVGAPDRSFPIPAGHSGRGQRLHRRKRAVTYNTWEESFTSRCTGGTRRNSRFGIAVPLFRKSPRLLPKNPPSKPGEPPPKARLPRRALAQDDRPRRRGVPLSHRAVFMIWRQPHPIFLRGALLAPAQGQGDAGEGSRRRLPDCRFYGELMRPGTRRRNATSSAERCNARRRFFERKTFTSPAFELTYWRWGLEAFAQQWRRRLGLPRDRNGMRS